MKKPKWRKYKGEWRRGVLEVRRSAFTGHWRALVGGCWIDSFSAPEEAMEAADDWWERTRKRMEGR